MRATCRQKAPFEGAFFFGAFAFGALASGCLLAPAAGAEPCPADRIDERAAVTFVVDGDTVVLADGRHVRFAGIDTPEIGREGAPSQPYAEAARDRLSARLPPGARVGLRIETERHDRYGRLLAHVYGNDEKSLQADLLERGLAVTLVVPPNGWGHACYARAERDARAGTRGVWNLARYRAVHAAELGGSARGFRIVRGAVGRVGESRDNVWLDLAADVSLRIPRADLGYFSGFDPRRLLGRRVEARGWVQRRRGQLRITVRHPAALTVLE